MTTTNLTSFRIERWTTASVVAVSLCVAAIVALAIAPAVLGAGAVDRLTALFIYIVLAAMWNALAGYGGLVSIGQQLFFGLGAYFTIRIANLGVDPFIAMAFGAIVTTVIAYPRAFHAEAEGWRVCHRHVGSGRTRAPARQSRHAHPGRNRHVADLAQRL